MTEPILQVKSLTKKFGKLTAVNQLSFEVFPGDVFGFLGPNGAGKTTTMRMLLGLLKPTSGHISFFGKDIQQSALDILPKIGALIDEPAFYGYLSGYSNLKLLGDLAGGVSKDRIMEVLKEVGLDVRARDRVSKYSRGMRVRLGLAQAMLLKPELLILDEPTAGLDPEGSREVQDWITRLASIHHVTVIISSHLLGEIERICNRVLIVSNGEKMVCDQVHQLLRSDSNWVEISTHDAEKALQFLKTCSLVINANHVNETNILAELKSASSDQLLALLVEAKIMIFRFNPVRKSLEDYFLSLMDKK